MPGPVYGPAEEIAHAMDMMRSSANFTNLGGFQPSVNYMAMQPEYHGMAMFNGGYGAQAQGAYSQHWQPMAPADSCVSMSQPQAEEPMAYDPIGMNAFFIQHAMSQQFTHISNPQMDDGFGRMADSLDAILDGPW